MIPRINFFGGPGVGKSTLAAKFFTRLKQRGHNVELVQEFVKEYVYTGRRVSRWDQVYTFGRQFGAELHVLEGGVRQIVTDSPLLLQAIYARYNGCPSSEQLAEISLEFDKQYPSVNFFVRREVPFKSVGRWGAEDEGRMLDQIITKELHQRDIDYYLISPLDPKDVDRHFQIVENL